MSFGNKLVIGVQCEEIAHVLFKGKFLQEFSCFRKPETLFATSSREHAREGMKIEVETIRWSLIGLREEGGE